MVWEEGGEPSDAKGEACNPLEHEAVGRGEDPDQYDETVNDVYQKGYRMADRILRSAMVTVTYGGEKRPAPEPEVATEEGTASEADASEAQAEGTEEERLGGCGIPSKPRSNSGDGPKG